MKNKQTYERSHVKCSAPIFGLDCHISPFLYQIQCHWSLPGNQRLFEKVRQLKNSLESSTKDNTTSNLFTKSLIISCSEYILNACISENAGVCWILEVIFNVSEVLQIHVPICLHNDNNAKPNPC